MTTKLITVDPTDSLQAVKEIFDEHNIHHIPVVRYKKLVGIISKSDFLQFIRGFRKNIDPSDEMIENTRLNTWRVEEIMTKGLAKVDSKEPIRTALGLFKMNRFHALPVVDDDELVGMVTTFDIISRLADEPIELDDYQSANT